MMTPKEAAAYAQNQIVVKGITVDQANVLMIQLEGVRVVAGKLPRNLRTVLNAAVKAGEIGHMKAEGHKPEVYYRIQSRVRALEVRARHERSAFEALAGCVARPFENEMNP